MFIGIDLGTSGVKVVLMDAQGNVVATETSPLQVSRPQPLWSEQDPESWWQALDSAMQALSAQQDLRAVQAIGLSGQMHGATLLDSANQVLRPAMLWNDGRSEAQCRELEQKVPDSRLITGNLMMPGFTAPKLLWVQQHEPAIFSQIAHVLLPKDYLRWRLSGDFATDMSDAAGTMWLDVAQRDWSDVMLHACDLSRDQMPQLCEGNALTGTLHADLATRWKMNTVPLAAGGGGVASKWEGKDANGNRMAPGKYSIVANHVDTAGTSTKLSTYVQAPVESVTVGSDGLYLNLKGLGTAPIDYVLRVS